MVHPASASIDDKMHKTKNVLAKERMSTATPETEISPPTLSQVPAARDGESRHVDKF
jgi:hypothetical protein